MITYIITAIIKPYSMMTLGFIIIKTAIIIYGNKFIFRIFEFRMKINNNMHIIC
jgi:hypothetical protein